MDDHDFDDAASILANRIDTGVDSPWDEDFDDERDEDELTGRALPSDDEPWDDPESLEEL